MFYNNPLLIKLKNKLYKKKKIEGIVKSTTKGFGFLEVDSKKTYFIPSKNMKKVIHGDRIIGLIKLENNKEIVYPKILIEPFLKKFIGSILKKNNIIYIQANYPYIKDLIFYRYKTSVFRSWKNGDWVIAELDTHSLRDNNHFSINILKFISEKNDPLTPWNVILSKYNLEKKSPKINFNYILNNNNLKDKRIDLTYLDFITIDNSNTQDIDDALFVKKTKKNKLTLIVAIADPTEYILINTKVDDIAKKRVFTNYLPGFNISMLPKEFSEDLCSLKPHVKRPVLACKIIIDNEGKILMKKTKFFLAWIESKGKLSYQNVSNWLEKLGNWQPDNKKIKKQILLLYKMYKIRNMWRKKNALIFPDNIEYKFHLSKTWEILNISVEKRSIAHKIVEESMISANICAASFLKKKLGFGLYNSHSGFDTFNAKNAINFLKKYNIIFTLEEIMTLSGFCKLKRKLNKLSNKYINYRIQKFQSFGEISLIPKPHFSLGLPYYATWTSPIRKYSDMINHRLIKSIIIGKKKISPPDTNIIPQIIHRKYKIRMALKEIEEWLYFKYYNKKKSDKKKYQANIIDISKGGIKARLLKTGAYIFIPVTYIHKIRHELNLNSEKGIIYIKNKIYYKVSDIIIVSLLKINNGNKKIIATMIN
ncbi:exoribonuclease II [Buchnera aphidicola]|uniref:Exoribonuclease 2 n=1 Tax=Buchnera aphidicola subsp. Cinara cedri (strain Cc) TaxID=372461 RepID=RNB_BUCCC|nr:exoribonuclease II [Buchnera aphidicola]Q057Q9.1 RecName: Full=Exoribonuclease 2; AltName: Full=Exoribonuclease II; Short=RNase II; Short=Ribonuclease II [Buchnera aphidicola BCc]ABJ90640.1 exoribonuclease II [Buchnera aphidicola BCc]